MLLSSARELLLRSTRYGAIDSARSTSHHIPVARLTRNPPSRPPARPYPPT